MLTFISHATGLRPRPGTWSPRPHTCTFSRRHWPAFPHSNHTKNDNTSTQVGSLGKYNCIMKFDKVQSLKTDDDDDDTLGGLRPVDGMRIPDGLTDEDREYLGSANSNEEFMRRMTSIAKRKDQQRLIDNARSGKQTSDSYMDSLDKVKMHRSEITSKPSPPAPTPSDPNPTVLHADEVNVDPSNRPISDEDVEQNSNDSIDDLEARIAKINQDLVQAMTNADIGTVKESEEEHTADLLVEHASKLESVQRQIQLELSGKEPDFDSLREQNEAVGERKEVVEALHAEENDPNIDRQIAYLESHLEKLKRDAAADGDAEKMTEEISGAGGGSPPKDEEKSVEAMREKALSLLEKVHEQATTMPGETPRSKPSAPSQPNNKEDPAPATSAAKFEGLENAAGEMSAEEKRAAFEAIRRQAMERQGVSEPADPFNVVLPSKRDGRPTFGDDFSLGRDARPDADGDVPTGDEAEYDSMGSSELDRTLLVQEIEVEMKSYAEESRRLLRNHESRMNVLLSRLVTSYDN